MQKSILIGAYSFDFTTVKNMTDMSTNSNISAWLQKKKKGATVNNLNRKGLNIGAWEAMAYVGGVKIGKTTTACRRSARFLSIRWSWHVPGSTVCERSSTRT